MEYALGNVIVASKFQLIPPANSTSMLKYINTEQIAMYILPSSVGFASRRVVFAAILPESCL